MDIRRRLLSSKDGAIPSPDRLTFGYGTMVTDTTATITGYADNYSTIRSAIEDGQSYIFFTQKINRTKYQVSSSILEFFTDEPDFTVNIHVKAIDEMFGTMYISQLDSYDITAEPMYSWNKDEFAVFPIEVAEPGYHYVKIYYKSALTVSGEDLEMYFRIEPYEVNTAKMTADPPRQYINIDATDAWSVKPATIPMWVGITPTSGNKGKTRVAVQCTRYTCGDPRSANIEFVCKGVSSWLQVVQEGIPEIHQVINQEEVLSLNYTPKRHLMDSAESIVDNYISYIGENSTGKTTDPPSGAVTTLGHMSADTWSDTYGVNTRIRLYNVPCKVNNPIACFSKNDPSCSSDNTQVSCAANTMTSVTVHVGFPYTDTDDTIKYTYSDMVFEQEPAICACDCNMHYNGTVQVCECDSDICDANSRARMMMSYPTVRCVDSPSCSCNGTDDMEDCAAKGWCSCDTKYEEVGEDSCGCYNQEMCPCNTYNEYSQICECDSFGRASIYA